MCNRKFATTSLALARGSGRRFYKIDLVVVAAQSADLTSTTVTYLGDNFCRACAQQLGN